MGGGRLLNMDLVNISSVLYTKYAQYKFNNVAKLGSLISSKT